MAEEPLAKRRGRGKRIDKQIEVTGVGKFKPAGSFVWYKIPKGGIHIPIGSQATFPDTGPGGTVDGVPVKPGSLAEVFRRSAPTPKPKRKDRKIKLEP